MVNEVIELLRISMPQRTSSITPNWETDIMNTVKDSGKMPNRHEPSLSHLCVFLGSVSQSLVCSSTTPVPLPWCISCWRNKHVYSCFWHLFNLPLQCSLYTKQVYFKRCLGMIYTLNFSVIYYHIFLLEEKVEAVYCGRISKLRACRCINQSPGQVSPLCVRVQQ